MAALALVEELAGVSRHLLDLVVATVRASDLGAKFGFHGHGDTANSFGNGTRLYASAVKAKAQSTLSSPRSLLLRIPATALIQPKASSMRLRMRRSRDDGWCGGQ